MNTFETSGETLSPGLSSKAMRSSLDRSTAPVFVVGCHRSGTNLIYDMLLSAGRFAIYRGYLPVYEKLMPRFGKFDKRSHRKRMIETWLRSQGFRRSGLDGAKLQAEILQECTTGGDFIRIVMGQIARQQNVTRWVVYNPDNVLRIPQIKADVPDALFIHIIRDGRDVALSLRKMGFRPFPWGRGSKSLLASAIYWEWIVRKGQQYGRAIPQDCIEVHYEDLVSDPRPTLGVLSEFLRHDLDYDRIRSQALGRLSESNSSFLGEAEQTAIQPVNRWKARLTLEQIGALESVIGKTLKQLGYGLTADECAAPRLYHNVLRVMYPAFFDTKLWLKANTPLGRLSDLSVLEASDAAAG